MQEYTVKVYDNGSKSWYQHGQLHRADGPAIEWANGSKHWYQNGKRHRADGPAIEWADGDKEWYLDGKRVDESEVLTPSCEGEVVEIRGKKYRLVKA